MELQRTAKPQDRGHPTL